MDKLRALNYFSAVATSGSFTKAAKILDVPASSVSRRIHDLESELGVALFHRSTRVVKLTELGTLYLEQITPAITALGLADEIVGQHSDIPSGVIRISAIPDYGRTRLLPALIKMRDIYPDIVCDIELSDHISNLTQNEVDIAVRATSTLSERAVARQLTSGTFILVASPQYLEQYGTPKNVEDLKSHRALLYRLPSGILYWQAKMADGWRELRLPPAFICNQGNALLAEALAGTGLALIPRWGIVDKLDNKELIHIMLDDADVRPARTDSSGIYLLYHRPKYAVKKIRLAVDFLLAELGESIEENI
jgi:DNA-binding transcriptional LysR family regulator